MSKLPANLSQLTENLKNVQNFARTAVAEIGTFIKMGKDGVWTMGTDEIEIEEGSRWAINPASFATGFSAFNDNGDRTGEEMRAMSEEPIKSIDLPPVDGKWGPQIVFQAKCLNGEDEGKQGLIYQRSRGGLEAATKLLEEVLTKAANGAHDVVAIIELDTAWYKHTKYGKIFKPVFNVVEWVNGDAGEEEAKQIAAPAEKDEEPEKEEPKRRSRRSRRAA